MTPIGIASRTAITYATPSTASVNCESGSPGARARIANTTKLISSSVGIAIRSRRPTYLPTSPQLCPFRFRDLGQKRAGGGFHPRRHAHSIRAESSLGPVGDVPHLRVPGVRLDALEQFVDA